MAGTRIVGKISIWLVIGLFLCTTNLMLITANARTTGDFSYNALDDGTIEITEYHGSDVSVEIPSEIDGYTVTGIGSDAFFESKQVESVSIPSSVIRIASGAFRRTKLYQSTDNRENGMLYIDDCLIDVSGSVSGDIEIKEGTRVIGGGAFYNCNEITNIKIPDSVIAIGYAAFNGCEQLQEIIIPDSVIYFDSFSMFEECSALRNAVIGNGVTYIDDFAFEQCENLREVILGESVERIGWKAFAYTGIDSIIIPDSVIEIDDQAFFCCDFLQNVTLGKGTKTIGESAFSCDNLENVEYLGSESMWRKISIGDYNEEFVDKVTIKGDNNEDGESIFAPGDDDANDKADTNTDPSDDVNFGSESKVDSDAKDGGKESNDLYIILACSALIIAGAVVAFIIIFKKNH